MNLLDPMDRLEYRDWLRGGAGGLLGSVLFGGVRVFRVDSFTLSHAIPALYGIEYPAPVAGWMLHLFHGMVLGFLYVLTVDRTGFRRVIDPRTLRGGVFHGTVCGVMFSAMFGLTVMPMWLHSVGFPNAPPVPNLRLLDVVWTTGGHLVYGNTVGIVYAVFRS